MKKNIYVFCVLTYEDYKGGTFPRFMYMVPEGTDADDEFCRLMRRRFPRMYDHASNESIIDGAQDNWEVRMVGEIDE